MNWKNLLSILFASFITGAVKGGATVVVNRGNGGTVPITGGNIGLAGLLGGLEGLAQVLVATPASSAPEVAPTSPIVAMAVQHHFLAPETPKA